ncbi:flocculation protein FLO11-like isoform X2 [Lucilia cuprina]|uniref:flocculation protein FLO11-like isoform X2 n=1 Tax=Lucilia cuprina TaxID=7375 RepID=UPI001F06921C|nr:flocculation protein FLO11-like isoform X2 [Lucilia cuprina]
MEYLQVIKKCFYKYTYLSALYNAKEKEQHVNKYCRFDHTDSNDLHCTHIQCPTKCPADSYLKSTLDDEEDEDSEDYEDELLGHDPYIEELGHFEELPPEEELHETHMPQHILKERQKREVFFQEEIERCCDNQKCVCNKCDDVPKCAAGHVAVEVHEGHGVPGNCCSIYRCVEKEECKIGVKQSWWNNKCHKCSCFGESELCMQICPEEEILQNCYSEYLQKPMMNGAIWKEGICTNCRCEQGKRRCFASACLNDDEVDERPEIVHDNEKDIEEVVEDYATESSTIETPLIRVNEETNSTISIENTNLPVIDDGLINEAHTISPLFGAEESSNKPFEIEEISSSTFKPETGDLFAGNSSHFESTTSESLLETMVNSTVSSILEISSSPVSSSEESLSSLVTSTEEPKLKIKMELDSEIPNNNTSSEEPKPIEDIEEISFTTTASSFDVSKSISIVEVEQDSSSTITTTEEPPTSSISTVTKNSSEIPVELFKDEITTPESLLATTTEEISSTTSRSHIGESSSIIEDIFSSTASTTASPIDFETTKSSETTVEINSVFSTTHTPETTMASYLSHSTSVATESTMTEETLTTIKTITSSTVSKLNSDETSTTTPLETTTSETAYSTPTTNSWTSTQTSLAITLSSDQFSTTISSTSTTSSPFSHNSDFTTSTEASISAESSSTSTTTAPEPLKPLYQPYGDFSTEERVPSTHNRMRIIFDEIDYVVMIVLFIGSMLCIALGLIIRHTKNRKKMYSSIPNSETSLSQTSTVIDVIPV